MHNVLEVPTKAAPRTLAVHGSPPCAQAAPSATSVAVSHRGGGLEEPQAPPWSVLSICVSPTNTVDPATWPSTTPLTAHLRPGKLRPKWPPSSKGAVMRYGALTNFATLAPENSDIRIMRHPVASVSAGARRAASRRGARSEPRLRQQCATALPFPIHKRLAAVPKGQSAVPSTGIAGGGACPIAE